MPKKLAPFRVPKGVPKNIARALRLPKPGRFLSTEKAFRLQDALMVTERETAAAHRMAAGAIERARTKGTRDKYFAELQRLQRLHGALQHGLDQLSASAAREPLPPLAGGDVVPVIEAPDFGKSYVLPGESAREWEIGVDYTAELAGGRHAQGRASDVSFNARLFHPDGEPLTEYQIREAVDHFAATGELSYRSGRSRAPLEVETVRWANWKGQASQSHHADDLLSFRHILLRVGDGGLRVGAVKEDML